MIRRALFVGVEDYDDVGIQKLRYAIDDAFALQGVFEDLGFETVCLKNPSQAEVLQAIKKSTKGLHAGDLFLFFFAGHGFSIGSEDLVFCPEDMLKDLATGTGAGLSHAKIKVRPTAEKGTGQYDRVFLFDTCRSFLAGGRGFQGNEKVVLPDGREVGTRDLNPVGDFTSDVEGSVFVMRSCGSGQESVELRYGRNLEKGNGLFTLALKRVFGRFLSERKDILLDSNFYRLLSDEMERIKKIYKNTSPQKPECSFAGNVVRLHVTGTETSANVGDTGAVDSGQCTDEIDDVPPDPPSPDRASWIRKALQYARVLMVLPIMGLVQYVGPEVRNWPNLAKCLVLLGVWVVMYGFLRGWRRLVPIWRFFADLTHGKLSINIRDTVFEVARAIGGWMCLVMSVYIIFFFITTICELFAGAPSFCRMHFGTGLDDCKIVLMAIGCSMGLIRFSFLLLLDGRITCTKDSVWKWVCVCALPALCAWLLAFIPAVERRIDQHDSTVKVIDAYKKGEYARAVEVASRADQEDVAVAAILAGLYLTGKGTDPDYEKAVRYTEKFIEKGGCKDRWTLAKAQWDIGRAYYKMANHVAAAEWFEKAGRNGCAEALFMLGNYYNYYVNGDGRVIRDLSRALGYYQQALAEHSRFIDDDNRGKVEKAVNAVKRQLAAERKQSAVPPVRNSQSRLEAKDRDEASFAVASALWSEGKYKDAHEEFARYIKEYPNGKHVAEAKAKIAECVGRVDECDYLSGYQAYTNQAYTTAIAEFEAYLEKHPNGKRAQEATQQLAEAKKLECQRKQQAAHEAFAKEDWKVGFDIATNLFEITDSYVSYHVGYCYSPTYGTEYPEQKSYANAYEKFKLTAKLEEHLEKGDGVAECILGDMELAGQGCVPDAEGSVKWYQRSAARNYGRGCYELGRCYEQNLVKDGKDNLAEATNLYWRAMSSGRVADSTNAYERVLIIMSLDAFRKKDWKRGVELALKTDMTERNVQFYLGCCYQNGLGGISNEVKAVEMYQAAAEQSHLEAQRNLADCYRYGIGVDQDKWESEKWYLMSITGGLWSVGLELGRKCVQKCNFESATNWFSVAMRYGGDAVVSNEFATITHMLLRREYLSFEFDFNKSKLSASAKEVLRKTVSIMQEDSKKSVIVSVSVAEDEESGSDGDRRNLMRKRFENVVDYLEENDIHRTRIYDNSILRSSFCRSPDLLAIRKILGADLRCCTLRIVDTKEFDLIVRRGKKEW